MINHGDIASEWVGKHGFRHRRVAVAVGFFSGAEAPVYCWELVVSLVVGLETCPWLI